MISWLRRPSQIEGRVETAADIRATAAYVEDVLGTPEGYRFAPGCPTTLLATSLGVCALELLGALDTLSEARRAQLTRSLRARQRQDGSFKDPLHGDEVLQTLRKFPPLYVDWQETYFALHALDALGAEPEHPLAFAELFQDRRVLEPWFRSLRFDDIWLSSNLVMFAASFFLASDAPEAAHTLLDLLDAWQDPETGFWGTGQGASLFNGMAGAFHFYGFYQYLDRPIAHQAAAVRSTLSLQEPSGLWGEPGGGPCEDLDAVDILVKLSCAPEDEERVQVALERALSALRACRNDDGGYRWLSPQPGVRGREHVYSGLPTLKTTSARGDLWSCWFRPLAIALAEDRLGRSSSWPLRYRRMPLLGWHPSE